MDLGAFDGYTGSNTRALAEKGWSGVCVEANPSNFTLLLKNCEAFPNVKCLNAAVMKAASIIPFYQADGQCGTALEDNFLGDLVKRVIHVAAVSPVQLADKFGDDFDFVSLDLEGVDLAVLSKSEKLLKNTKLLCLEDTIPNQPFKPSHYNELLRVAESFGFTKVVARTKTAEDKPANTLLAR